MVPRMIPMRSVLATLDDAGADIGVNDVVEEDVEGKLEEKSEDVNDNTGVDVTMVERGLVREVGVKVECISEGVGEKEGVAEGIGM